jgi:two-component system OmpR family response regulator
LAFDRPDRAKSDESRDPGRILVVDDDPMLRQMVVNYLNENNMRAVSAAGRQETARHFAESEPNLVILDLRLGEEDGLDLLREIRSHSDVPVIIATGQRSDEIDRIVGLELGADYYIVKPFGLRDLFARIRVVLRRQEMGRAVRACDPERGGYRFDGWRLDRRGRRLVDR